MNLSKVGGAAALQAYCNMFDNATLVFYGTPGGPAPSIPASPESTVSDTVSATFTFTAGAFSAPSYTSPNMVATANFSATTVTPTASAYVGYARALIESAATWAASTPYSAGAVVKDTTSANTYVCLVAGTSASSGNGPGGTGTAILDGTVVWMFVGATSGIVSLGDFTVGTSGTDIIVGSIQFSTGVQVNLSSFKLQIPVV